jgi:hypothetical protein
LDENAAGQRRGAQIIYICAGLASRRASALHTVDLLDAPRDGWRRHPEA